MYPGFCMWRWPIDKEVIGTDFIDLEGHNNANLAGMLIPAARVSVANTTFTKPR